MLCITFTNRAARELASRLDAIAAERVLAGTFYPIAHRLVPPYAELIGRGRDFSICDKRASRKLAEGELMGIIRRLTQPKTPAELVLSGCGEAPVVSVWLWRVATRLAMWLSAACSQAAKRY